jgi:hypothetical protein
MFQYYNQEKYKNTLKLLLSQFIPIHLNKARALFDACFLLVGCLAESFTLKLEAVHSSKI